MLKLAILIDDEKIKCQLEPINTTVREIALLNLQLDKIKQDLVDSFEIKDGEENA